MTVSLEQLTEQSTRHAVYLERLKSGEVNQFAAFLKQIDRTIRQRLSGEDLTEYSRTRLNKLLAALNRDLNTIYDDYWNALSGNLIDLADYEAGFEVRSLNSVAQGAFEAVVPAANQIVAAVTSTPLSVRGADGGKLLEPFVKDWTATEVKRVSGAIRQGFFEGQTTSKILQAVRGTRANGYRDGILATTNRNAEAIVRTAVQHVASIARNETWKANSDIVAGVEWVSTLDSKTSQQCRSLDGQFFPTDKGPRPPIHIRCRSTTVARLDDRYSFLSEDATRAARAPDGSVGRVDAGTTYYSWLKRQPAAFQDSVIGPTRGSLLRNGGLTAERFSEINLGRNFEPLSLDEMRRIEPLAFAKSVDGAKYVKNPSSPQGERVIGQFLAQAAAGGKKQKPVSIGVMPKEFNSPVDVTGRYIALDHDRTRHIFLRHGTDTERMRGQLPVTSADLSQLVRVIESAGSAVLGKTPKTNSGSDLIDINTRYNGFNYNIVLEVRKWAVVPYTMWKSKR